MVVLAQIPMAAHMPSRADMLAQLTGLHGAILTHIDALNAVTRTDAPDAERLARVRLQLTRASRQRRRLIHESIVPAIQPVCRADELFGLEKLRLDRVAQAAYSSQHIGIWTMARIVEDWAGYRHAMARMGVAMKANVETERRVLYPLLGRPEPVRRS